MKLKYLGTAAAEGIPAIFCNCDTCKEAAKKKGKNIRTRSQAIIDGKLLIDFPPDTYLHVLKENINLMDIEHCIVTHSHPDHLYAEDFKMRRKGFSHFAGKKETCLMVYSSEKTGQPIITAIKEDHLDTDNRVKHQVLKPFVPVKIGGYSVTPYKAHHDESTEPFFYAVSDGKKALLYANDTGYFPEETWAELKRKKSYFDFVSFDCTEVQIANKLSRHMGLPVIEEVIERLKSYGCIDSKTKLCLHHFSHNGHYNYDALVPLAKKKGFLVSYDGMEVEL